MDRVSHPSDPPPSAFGRYEVLFPIDRGGMAEVLACRIRGEGHFERYFAVKRMAKEMIRHEKFVQSFLDEARLTGSIHSPNVVQVVDLGRDDRGAPFLVMELVKGVSLSALRKRLEGVPLPLGAVVEIGSQAASGLEDAHTATDARGESLGIVHRDISPQNILLGIDGRVRIADFGIARAKQRLAQATQSGELKGKFAYFAPEQLRGEASQKTDVFALGVVLWELVAGKALFSRPEVLDTIMAVERLPIPRLDSIRDDVPPAFASVVARALEREVSARWATAGELSNALRELLDKRVVKSVSAAELRQVAYRGAEPLLKRLQEAAGPAPLSGRESLGESFSATPPSSAAPVDSAAPTAPGPDALQVATTAGPRPRALERTTVRDLAKEIAASEASTRVVSDPGFVLDRAPIELEPSTGPRPEPVTTTPGLPPEDVAIEVVMPTARGVRPQREDARDTARDLETRSPEVVAATMERIAAVESTAKMRAPEPTPTSTGGLAPRWIALGAGALVLGVLVWALAAMGSGEEPPVTPTPGQLVPDEPERTTSLAAPPASTDVVEAPAPPIEAPTPASTEVAPSGVSATPDPGEATPSTEQGGRQDREGHAARRPVPTPPTTLPASPASGSSVTPASEVASPPVSPAPTPPVAAAQQAEPGTPTTSAAADRSAASQPSTSPTDMASDDGPRPQRPRVYGVGALDDFDGSD